ncbi:hypothetical protein EDB19DRAFT_2028492 [Suillus lakei]|nr:hypothetical protein EDB19DRAFT_2028492 [Suillus lakei]
MHVGTVMVVIVQVLVFLSIEPRYVGSKKSVRMDSPLHKITLVAGKLDLAEIRMALFMRVTMLESLTEVEPHRPAWAKLESVAANQGDVGQALTESLYGSVPSTIGNRDTDIMASGVRLDGMGRRDKWFERKRISSTSLIHKYEGMELYNHESVMARHVN